MAREPRWREPQDRRDASLCPGAPRAEQTWAGEPSRETDTSTVGTSPKTEARRGLQAHPAGGAPMQSRTPETDLPATAIPGCGQRSNAGPDALLEEHARPSAGTSRERADTVDFIVEW